MKSLKTYVVMAFCAWMFTACMTAPIGERKIHDVEGYWINPNGKGMLKVSPDKVLYTPFDGSRHTQVMSFSWVADNQYEVYAQNGNRRMTLGANSLSIDGIKMEFVRPVRITVGQLSGRWYHYTKDKHYESSQIVKQNHYNYDIEYVELDHNKGTYWHDKKMNVPLSFSDGFRFSEGEGRDAYKYFLLEFDLDRVVYVDIDGVVWSEERYRKQPMLTRPAGYREI